MGNIAPVIGEQVIVWTRRAIEKNGIPGSFQDPMPLMQLCNYHQMIVIFSKIEPRRRHFARLPGCDHRNLFKVIISRCLQLARCSIETDLTRWQLIHKASTVQWLPMLHQMRPTSIKIRIGRQRKHRHMSIFFSRTISTIQNPQKPKISMTQ
jgi:hypothetical protein